MNLGDVVSGMIAALGNTHGCRIIIARGGESCVASALRGKSEYNVATEEGLSESLETQDFVLLGADYAPTGAASEPAVGDRITRSVGLVTWTFEVMKPAESIQCWAACDPNGVGIRVHTKRVS